MCPNCRIEDVAPHADLAECVAELGRRRQRIDEALAELNRRRALDRPYVDKKTDPKQGSS